MRPTIDQLLARAKAVMPVESAVTYPAIIAARHMRQLVADLAEALAAARQPKPADKIGKRKR